MSASHLTTGSTCPAKVEGKLRLYSMEYCPYAQRSRLVLKAKKIPHEIVNINLINKPEWYFQIHPEGKVPALDTGNEIVVESTDICDFLDEKYPENSLYPQDQDAKQKDKELIQKIGPLTGVFTKCMLGLEEKSLADWANDFTQQLQVFEDELSRRGTSYFGGEKPGMVDYMLWPWAERSGVITIILGERLPFGADQLSLLRRWKKLMRQDSVCDGIYHGPEKFWKTVQIKKKEIPPDYDSV